MTTKLEAMISNCLQHYITITIIKKQPKSIVHERLLVLTVAVCWLVYVEHTENRDEVHHNSAEEGVADRETK